MKIGVDLGGSHIGLGVIDSEYNLIEKFEKWFSDEEKKDATPVIENYIIEKVKELENKYEIESIGVAVPGSSKDGIILKAVNLGIYNYNLGGILEEKFKKKVTIRNDAKCACLAEFNNIVKKDKSKKDCNMLFLAIGTGIGGGIIYNGKLLQGHHFEGFELGHVVIKENGIPCKCGRNGCFERYGSILQYKNKVRHILNLPNDLNSDPLREEIKLHEKEIEDINIQYIQDLAIGIANYINIFEPDIIVLGGGYTHFHYMFEDSLKTEILNSSLFNKRESIDLRVAELENDAGIIGACC